MRMLSGVYDDVPASVHLQPHAPIVRDTLKGAQLAVGHLQVVRGRGELDAVSNGERPLPIAVDGDSLLPARVVGQLRTVRPDDGEQVLLGVHALDAGVLAFLEASLFRAARVQEHVVRLVADGPRPVGSGEVLPGHERLDAALFPAHHATRPQLGMDALLISERLSGETTRVLSGDLAYSLAMASMRWAGSLTSCTLP